MNRIKNIGRGLVICLAMYSVIPMPTIEWEEESMKYTMCFFPIIGVVIGVVMIGAYTMLGRFTMIFQGVVLLLIPIVISGGIHIDGLIDTCDAYFSYGEKEKKLEILKDPRTGAFGVIGAMVYMLSVCAVYTQILENEMRYMMALPMIYVMSRAIGALCMMLMPNAKRDGLGASFANASSQKIVCIVLGLWLLAGMVGIWMIHPYLCMILIGLVALFLLCILPIYQKKFGGITGDLTGCIVALLELILPLGMAIGGVML